MRSNLSVDCPIDLIRYKRDSLKLDNVNKYHKDTPYWVDLRNSYSDGLMSVISGLPNPLIRVTGVQPVTSS